MFIALLNEFYIVIIINIKHEGKISLRKIRKYNS